MKRLPLAQARVAVTRGRDVQGCLLARYTVGWTVGGARPGRLGGWGQEREGSEVMAP